MNSTVNIVKDRLLYSIFVCQNLTIAIKIVGRKIKRYSHRLRLYSSKWIKHLNDLII